MTRPTEEIAARDAARARGYPPSYRSRLLHLSALWAYRRAAVRLHSPDAFGDVRLSSSFLPVHVTGMVLDGARRDEPAGVVNGRIVALAQQFTQAGARRFQTLVPESSFREGRTRVDVFAITGSGAHRRLVWL